MFTGSVENLVENFRARRKSLGNCGRPAVCTNMVRPATARRSAHYIRIPDSELAAIYFRVTRRDARAPSPIGRQEGDGNVREPC
jgi:hypothetical protein